MRNNLFTVDTYDMKRESWLNDESATTFTYPGMSTYFECGSGEFISIIGVCNRVRDCSDGTDEKHCSEELGMFTRIKCLLCS